MAFALMSVSLIAGVSRGVSWCSLALSASICVAAALAEPFLIVSEVLCAVSLTLMVALPPNEAGAAVYAPLLPVYAATKTQRFCNSTWATGGYLVLLIGLTWRRNLTALGLVLSMVGWIFFFGISWMFGLAVSAARLAERARLAVQAAGQRRDIALELHDTIIHDLTAMLIYASSMRLEGRATSEDEEYLRTVGEHAAVCQGNREPVAARRFVCPRCVGLAP